MYYNGLIEHAYAGWRQTIVISTLTTCQASLWYSEKFNAEARLDENKWWLLESILSIYNASIIIRVSALIRVSFQFLKTCAVVKFVKKTSFEITFVNRCVLVDIFRRFNKYVQSLSTETLFQTLMILLIDVKKRGGGDTARQG